LFDVGVNELLRVLLREIHLFEHWEDFLGDLRIEDEAVGDLEVRILLRGGCARRLVPGLVRRLISWGGS
jgi:hypothetical protein